MIFKINTGWVRAVEGSSITDRFGDAWGNILNALAGPWGSVTFDIVAGQTATAIVSGGRFLVEWSTSVGGAVSLLMPFERSGNTLVEILDYDGAGLVIDRTEYVVAETATQLSTTLTAGSKLVRMSGTARRL